MTPIAFALVYYSFSTGVTSAQEPEIGTVPLTSSLEYPALPLIPRVSSTGGSPTPLLFHQHEDTNSQQESWPLWIFNKGALEPVAPIIMVASQEMATNGMGTTVMNGSRVKQVQDSTQLLGTPQELLPPLQFHLIPRLPLELWDPAPQSGEMGSGQGNMQGVNGMGTSGQLNQGRIGGTAGNDPGEERGEDQARIPGSRWRIGTRQFNDNAGSNAYYSTEGGRGMDNDRNGSGGRGYGGNGETNGSGDGTDRSGRGVAGGRRNSDFGGRRVANDDRRGSRGYDGGAGDKKSVERAHSMSRQPRDSSSFISDNVWNSQVNNAQWSRLHDLTDVQNSNYLYPHLMGIKPYTFSNYPRSYAFNEMIQKMGEWDKKSSGIIYDQRRFDKRAVRDQTPHNADFGDIYDGKSDQTADHESENGMSDVTGERNPPSDPMSTGDTDNDDAWRRYVIQRMEAQEKYNHPSMEHNLEVSPRSVNDGPRQTDPPMIAANDKDSRQRLDDSLTNDIRTAIRLIQKPKFRALIGEPLVFELLYVLYKVLDGSLDDGMQDITNIDVSMEGNTRIPSSRGNNQQPADSDSKDTTNCEYCSNEDMTNKSADYYLPVSIYLTPLPLVAPGSKTGGTSPRSPSSTSKTRGSQNTSKHGNGRGMNDDDDDSESMQSSRYSPTSNNRQPTDNHINSGRRDAQESTDQSESWESPSTQRPSRNLKFNNKDSTHRGFKWISSDDGGRHNHRGPYITTFRATGKGESRVDSTVPKIHTNGKGNMFSNEEQVPAMRYPTNNNRYHKSLFTFEEEGDGSWSARKKRDGTITGGRASSEPRSNYKRRHKEAEEFFNRPLYASEHYQGFEEGDFDDIAT